MFACVESVCATQCVLHTGMLWAACQGNAHIVDRVADEDSMLQTGPLIKRRLAHMNSVPEGSSFCVEDRVSNCSNQQPNSNEARS